MAKLKADQNISITAVDGKYLSKNTDYTVKIEASRYGLVSASSKKITTSAYTYYRLEEGKKLYTITDGKAPAGRSVAPRTQQAQGQDEGGESVKRSPQIPDVHVARRAWRESCTYSLLVISS